MESVGINLGYLLVQLINLVLLVGWPLLTLLGLFQLRRRELPQTALAIWVVIVLFVPIVGALAFWIVRPGRPKTQGVEVVK
jgi:hypothetical protein